MVKLLPAIIELVLIDASHAPEVQPILELVLTDQACLSHVEVHVSFLN
jgi:hypothetical protein